MNTQVCLGKSGFCNVLESVFRILILIGRVKGVGDLLNMKPQQNSGFRLTIF